MTIVRHKSALEGEVVGKEIVTVDIDIEWLLKSFMPHQVEGEVNEPTTPLVGNSLVPIKSR